MGGSGRTSVRDVDGEVDDWSGGGEAADGSGRSSGSVLISDGEESEV